MPASNLSQEVVSVAFNTDDEDDLDEDEDAEDGSPATAAGKKATAKSAKGKKNVPAAKGKDAKAAQHRKEQNRAAQREFRQRKQQYIRALEARVELLSSDHDTQVNRLRFALRHLLAENNSLRNIVGSLAHFIGKRSIGGCLTESGMTREMLEATMNSTSEKVMAEAWANWPGAGECEALKEIRKESNIPPEGLPESKLATYFRDMNNKSASDATNDAAAGDKKKRTADDTANKEQKRKRRTDDTPASSTGGAPNTATTSSNHSSPSTRADVGIGQQTFVSSPQSMGANNMNARWQQQQQQQQQLQQQSMSAALPSQFWQPSQIGLQRQGYNDVESMFAQTLLGGGGDPDLSNFASLFQNGGVSQGLFSPNEAASYNAMVPNNNAGGTNGVNPAANLTFLGFGQQGPVYPNTATTATAGYATGVPTASASTQSASRSTGDVEAAVIPSGCRPSPEQRSALRRRHARIAAQVNRIWAKRGATSFLNLPSDYHLDEDDVKFIEQEEASNPQVKLSGLILPNNWDEGDMSSQGTAKGSPANPTANIENKAEAFQQLSYHMHNHYANPNYSLPPILKPTPLQQSTPHDHMIDVIPWPSLRDKLIGASSTYRHNIIVDLARFLSLGGGDINSERNWVLSLPFFIRHPELADAAKLADMNRQRVAKGEPEVSMDDVWKEHRKFQEYTQAKLKELS